MQGQFNKILISSPTASAKDYCFKEWIENIMNFKYPNFIVRVFDNSVNEGRLGQSSFERNIHFFDSYGDNNAQFYSTLSATQHVESMIERMCISHNDCRDELLKGDYTHLLHLETDVFPPHDVIERLLSHQKQVVGAVYHRDEGAWRKPMLQRHVYNAPKNVMTQNFNSNEEATFMDGTLKQVASVGLGCVLIRRDVLEKIKFRFTKGQDLHPDTFFSEDCFRNKIGVYADTSIICRHDNKAWGKYGEDYK